MNKKKLTKKGYLAIIISSSILMVLSLVLIIICAVIAKHIEYKYFEAIIVVIFFAMNVIALILLLSNYKRIIEYEFLKAQELYENNSYTTVKGIDNEMIKGNLSINKFKLIDDNLYYKKSFTFSKDIVHYYYICVNGENLEEAIERATNKFDEYGFRKTNMCLICLVSLESVTDEDLEQLVKVSASFLAMNTVLVNSPSTISLVIGLLNNSSNELYYINPPKAKLTLFKYGVEMLKKLLKHK